MGLIADQCLCLRKVEYSETSQILLLLGRQRGLVRVIAKGAHRRTKAGSSRFGGGIDLLEMGQAVFTDRLEKDLATLTEWSLVDGHLELRRSLRGLNLGFFGAELIGLLIEQRDPHPEIFDNFEATLRHLATPLVEQVMLAFELELLRSAGYLPKLDSCAGCGGAVSAPGAYFSAERGGVLCQSCEGAYPDRLGIERSLIDLMGYILRLKEHDAPAERLPRLTRRQTDPIHAIIVAHVQHTLGRALHTAAYVTPRSG